jgi:MFS family permease
MQLGRIAASALPIVLVLYALTVYDSPPLAGALTFLSLFPGLVAAPVIGALLDRFGRLRLIRVDYVVTTVGASVLTMLVVVGQLPEAALIGVTFVLGVTQMFSDSGLRSIFPRLAPAHLWERVNAVDSTGYAVATIVGPPTAATLFVIGGAAPAFATIALLYAGAWLALRGAHEPAGPPPEDVRLVDATIEGLRYVWHNPTLRAISLGVSPTSVCFGIVVILLPILLIDRLAAPGWTVGLALSLSGLLGIVAAVALGRSSTLGRERMLISAASLGITTSALVLLPSTSVAVALGLACVFGAAALFGVAGGVWDVSVFTVRQRRTDPRLMGRAFAISIAINSVGYPIGAALGGWLATQSIALAIFVAVGFGMVGTVLGWLTLPARDDSAASVATPVTET